MGAHRDGLVTALKPILIADGNESVAELFADVFASHGWNVTRCSDVKRTGEELCGGTHYDAVLVSYRFERGTRQDT